jgi:hypothetical protein
MTSFVGVESHDPILNVADSHSLLAEAAKQEENSRLTTGKNHLAAGRVR